MYKICVDTIKGYFKIFRVVFLPRSSFNKQSIDKKAIMLAWKFPPQISGGVYRPASFVRYAIDNGWDVTVVTERPLNEISTAGKYLLNYVGDAVKTIHIDRTKLSPSFKFFPRIDGGIINALDTIYKIMPTVIENKPSVTLASGPPFHNFIVAYLLYKFANIPYILDYRDEWSENPFPFVEKSRLNKVFETICLKYARKVIFTTERQRKHQLSIFPVLDESRTCVITNGWEPDDFNLKTETEKSSNENQFIITFAGALSDHTLPDRFLSSIEKILDSNEELRNNLLIKFIGSKSPRAMKQLTAFRYQKNLCQIDHMQKVEALAAMKMSNMLLLLNSKEFERYIPGKLYDYLATGAPILSFGKGGEIDDIVSNLSAGIAVSDDDSNELEKALMTNFKSGKDNVISKKTHEWLDNHTRKKSALKLIDILYKNYK